MLDNSFLTCNSFFFFFLKLRLDRTDWFHTLGRISPQWFSELRWLWLNVPWQVACVSFPDRFPHCLDSGIVSPLRLLGVTCHQHFWHNDRGLLHATAEARIACWLECRTRDPKVASSNPSRSGRRIFLSIVSFVCWLFIRCPFHPHVTAISCTLIPLFIPGSVHSGLASWDNCGRMFPDKLCVSLFPDRFPHCTHTTA